MDKLSKRIEKAEAEIRASQFKRCDWHRPVNLDFLSAHADADERLERGEKQRMCPLCGYWHWAHEWGDEPKFVPPLPVIYPEDVESV